MPQGQMPGGYTGQGALPGGPNPSPVQPLGTAPNTSSALPRMGGALMPGEAGYSQNHGESLGPSLRIQQQTTPNPSPIQPLPVPPAQGHIMASAQPWLEQPHHPSGPGFQRPLEEIG